MRSSLLTVAVTLAVLPGIGCTRDPGLPFDISIAPSALAEATTGRIFLALAPAEDPEPRIAAYNSARQRDGRVPYFAIDVEALAPGPATAIDAGAIGYPYPSLTQLPAGDYWVQAILNVCTRFERADGHTIYAHMDQWEG